MYRAKAAGGGFELAAAGVGAARRTARDCARSRAGDRARRADARVPAAARPEPERVSGVEALLRWHHPQLGAIDPENLIRLAEASGEIVAIGEWALREACTFAAGWPANGCPVRLAVNVAASQLARRDFVAAVRRILDASGLPAPRLELELTETGMLNQIDRLTASLTALHEMGVRLALDDFGTGYASLSHLRQFPLDALKIDRRFVAELTPSPGAADAAIVRSLIELAHRLGLEVVAEGVENEAQLAALRAARLRHGAGPRRRPSARARRSRALARRAGRGRGLAALTFARPPLRKPLSAARLGRRGGSVRPRRRASVMARRCMLTGKGVMTGNNVSHAHNKTRRRFLPNLRQQRLYSETLGESIRLRISANAIRTVEHRGGLDGFLLGAPDRELSGDLRRLKRRIEAACGRRPPPRARNPARRSR